MNSPFLDSISAFFLIPTLILGFLLLSSYLPRWRRCFKYKNLVPGPHCLPLVGYLPFFDVKEGYVKLGRLAKKYNGLCSIYAGKAYIVVLDDFQALKSAYSKDEFLNRPQEMFQMDPNEPSFPDRNGHDWREQRRFLMGSFRKSGVYTKDFEPLIIDLMQDFSRSLTSQEGSDVNFTEEVDYVLNNITFRLLFGKKFGRDHPIFRLMLDYDHAMQTFYLLNGVGTFFPWLGWLAKLRPDFKKSRKILKRMEVFLSEEIEEHRSTLNPEKPRDYIDHFLTEMSKSGADPSYNNNDLMGNLKVIVGAAGATTRVMLVWVILLLAKHPELQRRAQKEVDSVLGKDRNPDLESKSQFPFTEAFIMEALRWRNVIHYNFLRRTTEDTTLLEFDIPKDTLIVHNMTSHFRNPKYWTRPDEFDPSRFLSQDGSKVIVPEHYIPFSYGKRNCPGEKLAQITMILFVVKLLQRFTFLPPEGGVNLDVEVIFINEPRHPFARSKTRI